METKIYETIFKDYTNKLNLKFESDKSADINSMICYFNWCFLYKNNFFVNNFNSKYIKNVCDTYNTLKTNILVNTDKDIFNNIHIAELKRLKFILHNYIHRYSELSKNPNNKLLCELITIDSIRNCISMVNEKINKLNNSILNNI